MSGANSADFPIITKFKMLSSVRRYVRRWRFARWLRARLAIIEAFLRREGEWRRRRYVSDSSPIIVGGCGRSGTTLMRVILDSHPKICCGPESALFLPRIKDKRKLRSLAYRFDLPLEQVQEILKKSWSQAEFIDMFFAKYSSTMGKPRWADKTPGNIEYLDYIFEHFPQARFIHVIRDGRDTVCSLRTYPHHEVVDGNLVEVNTRNPLRGCIERWVEYVRVGIAYRGDPRYIEIRYEDLVSNTEETLGHHEFNSSSRDVRKFPGAAEAVKPIYTSAIGKWRTELTSKEAALFKRMAGPLLIELGYTSDNCWEPDALN